LAPKANLEIVEKQSKPANIRSSVRADSTTITATMVLL
jgi:hypothetical protein